MGSSNFTLVQKRDHPPSSYCLKIQNFSRFEELTAFNDNKYQTCFFSSGGYNWRLIVYPKGNLKDNGSGFISIYVEIDSTSLMESTTPSEVFAELRFFVYNKKENKYFTIQEVETIRFNALRLVWGLPKVLLYDTFINPANGFMFDGGQCEFGVDVIVAPPLTNWDILSFDEKLLGGRIFWTVKNFSKLKETIYSPGIYPMGGKQWVIKLYPKGKSSAYSKWLSLFVSLANNGAAEPNEKVFFQGHLEVRNPFGSDHFKHYFKFWHQNVNEEWGWNKFLSLAKVRRDYLDKKDSLTVEIEFKTVFTTKYSQI